MIEEELGEADPETNAHGEDDEESNSIEPVVRMAEFASIFAEHDNDPGQVVDLNAESHDQQDVGVGNQLEEILSIEKADTTVKPWAMMIHVQDANVASGAVMTSLRFESMADDTVGSAPFFRIIQIEALSQKVLPRNLEAFQGAQT